MQRIPFESMLGTIRLSTPRTKKSSRSPTSIKGLRDLIAAQDRELEVLRGVISNSQDEVPWDPCHCKRCGDRFGWPTLVNTHKCWPGYPCKIIPLSQFLDHDAYFRRSLGDKSLYPL